MKKNEPKVRFETLNPNDLKSDGLNPNTMTDSEMEALKTCITKYGFVSPIIVNESMVITDGEQRWRASKELKLEKVPVVVVDVKEVDRKILRQVMNKLKGKHDPTLDLAEFRTIYNEDGLKMLEKMSMIPEDHITDLLENYKVEDLCLDAIDKNAFYGEEITVNDAIDINIGKIKPNKWNPTNLGAAGYLLLKKSIKAIGLINPIVVRPKKDFYEVIDGEQRWKASKELGRKTIQAKIINVKNDLEAKAISFSLNKIKGKLDGNKSNILINELNKDSKDNTHLQNILGLDKKNLGRYIALGENGKYFETPSGLVVRQYDESEYDEKSPSLVVIFDNSEDLEKVRKHLAKIDKDIAKALIKVCKS
jgi:ParB/RepB/Spo0J family partition protein